MEIIHIINAGDKEIANIADQLSTRVYTVSSFDNLFEFKRKCETETPDTIFVADNLKEKNIGDLLASISQTSGHGKTPMIGFVTQEKNQERVLEFFQHGAVDVIHPPYDLEEIVARMHLRIKEATVLQRFTSGEFFFNEAQEKEHAKRTGIFKFFESNNIEVGNVCIQGGRVVHATYGSLIKEDAFLQLACNSDLKFTFEDTDEIPRSSINEGITNLLLEASKLKDEIKRQESDGDGDLKSIVIDENRIARILASRVMKNLNFNCKITSPKEMTVRFMANFAPQVIILDYYDAEQILNMLWPTPRKDTDIPVIIYCDEDVKDINFTKIKSHCITGTVYKNMLHKEIKSILQKLKIL
jgi:PleD family two-component response regulator